MKKDNSIKFTLLTACKNEEVDIHLAIKSTLSQTYPNKEIIFVDDSTDHTKEIIRGYADKGIILIDGEGKGCCQARNLGMRRATGDVIVFLTADTNLEPHYLEKIAPYYEEGYDYVMVESYSNLDSAYSRFVQAEHLSAASRPDYNPFTTQGHSVRRSVALAVGGISGGEYPVNFCRDWTLVKKMQEQGHKGVIDRSILVPHKSPDEFREYWRVQKTRGLMSAYQPYFLFHRTIPYLFMKFTVKSLLSFLHFALIIPALWHTAKLTKHLSHPMMYFFPMYYVYFIHRFTRSVGEWQGWAYTFRFDRKREMPS